MTELVAATGNSVAHITLYDEGWRAVLSLQGSGMQCLAVDPVHAGTLYAGSQGQGLWRSGDGGAAWERLSFPQPDVFSVAVSPVDGAVYAGCEPSMLFRSDDGGASWPHCVPYPRRRRGVSRRDRGPRTCAGLRPARTTRRACWWVSSWAA